MTFIFGEFSKIFGHFFDFSVSSILNLHFGEMFKFEKDFFETLLFIASISAEGGVICRYSRQLIAGINIYELRSFCVLFIFITLQMISQRLEL
jgi:hypothetical protein